MDYNNILLFLEAHNYFDEKTLYYLKDVSTVHYNTVVNNFHNKIVNYIKNVYDIDYEKNKYIDDKEEYKYKDFTSIFYWLDDDKSLLDVLPYDKLYLLISKYFINLENKHYIGPGMINNVKDKKYSVPYYYFDTGFDDYMNRIVKFDICDNCENERFVKAGYEGIPVPLKKQLMFVCKDGCEYYCYNCEKDGNLNPDSFTRYCNYCQYCDSSDIQLYYDYDKDE